VNEQNACLRGWNFAELKTLIGENDSSGSVDPSPLRGRPHTGHTAANISRVEYLTLIFLKVHSAQ